MLVVGGILEFPFLSHVPFRHASMRIARLKRQLFFSDSFLMFSELSAKQNMTYLLHRSINLALIMFYTGK